MVHLLAVLAPQPQGQRDGAVLMGVGQNLEADGNFGFVPLVFGVVIKIAHELLCDLPH